MDSKEESIPMRNIPEQEVINVECNSSKNILKHQGHGDGNVDVCAPMSHENESLAHIQGSADLKPIMCNENKKDQTNSSVHLGDLSDTNCTKISCNATSSQCSNQIASSSKCTPNSNKNIGSECERASSQTNKTNTIKNNVLCDLNEPSTSGVSLPCNRFVLVQSSSEGKENKKRPSTLRLKRPIIDGEDSSSDTGNDDYSLGSEDGCIYTYRGVIPPANPVGPQQAVAIPRAPGSRVSSPDMDFLEMDFDPGPSCEADTGDESTPEADIEVASVPDVNEHAIRGTSPEYQPSVAQPHSINIPVASGSSIKASIFDLPPINSEVEVPPESTTVVKKIRRAHTEYITHVNVRGERLKVRRTMCHWVDTKPPSVHGTNGDLVSAKDIVNFSEEQKDVAMVHQINQGDTSSFDSVNLTAALYHVNMAKKLIDEKPSTEEAASSVQEEAIAGPSQSSEPCIEPPRSMVWSEREACEQQVTQIGTSACGATAVVNVFLALGVPVDIERINTAVGTRQRANNAPIPRYLLSRSIAGCTAADIVTGIQKASDGLVTARFFPTYPERSLSLSHWLADWISLGAVPILTLNLQQGCEGEIPDAWHHQMVFGVSPQGVYLCNPVECVPENILWSRLVSPSVLLVRSRDIISRFNPETDMSPLTAVPDVRFHKMNVLGQVANVIREWRHAGCGEAAARTRHVRVPAAYQPGVTLAALTGSEAHRRLAHAAPPPRLAPAAPATTPPSPTDVAALRFAYTWL